MIRYSVQPRDLIFVIGNGFLSFDENVGKNIGKNLSKKLTGKYSYKLLDHAKQSATDALNNTSKRAIQKTAEATGDLIGNETAIRITKVSKIHNKLIQRQLQMIMIKKYLKKVISPEERQKIIDNLRLI